MTSGVQMLPTTEQQLNHYSFFVYEIANHQGEGAIEKLFELS